MVKAGKRKACFHVGASCGPPPRGLLREFEHICPGPWYLSTDPFYLLLQWQFSVVTPTSRAPSLSINLMNPLPPPLPTTSPAMIRRRSGECTFISSETIPMAAPARALTVSLPPRQTVGRGHGASTPSNIHIHQHRRESIRKRRKRRNGNMQ